ncbi:hypothetical protein FKM82_020917 [Ascaphus truei]
MLLQRLPEHYDVVKVHQALPRVHVPNGLFHQTLERGGGPAYSLRHTRELIESQGAYEGRLLLVFRVHGHLIVPGPQVQHTEPLIPG